MSVVESYNKDNGTFPQNVIGTITQEANIKWIRARYTWISEIKFLELILCITKKFGSLVERKTQIFLSSQQKKTISVYKSITYC